MSERRPALADPVPGTMYVDQTPDGLIAFSTIAEEDLHSNVVYMTTANAAKLGQILIDTADRIERARRAGELP